MPDVPAPTRLALALPIALALGCISGPGLKRETGPILADPPAAAPAADRSTAPEEAIDAVLNAARATLGLSDPQLNGRPLPTECSGYLRGLYLLAGVDLFSEGLPSDGGVRAMVRWVERHGVLHRHKVPSPGDLVFFDNSYDRNGDGRLNDRLTHAGIVEEVLADGTVLIIHSTNHGIVREPMNLFRPREEADGDGRRINAPLRRKTSRDPPRTPRLMSELFSGFGTVLPRAATSASRL
jgi:peptidoglycan DL-endopeptidase CwlO